MKLFLLTLALTGCAVSAFSGEDAVEAFLDEGVGLPCQIKPCIPVCKPVTKHMSFGGFSIPYTENVCGPDKACVNANAVCQKTIMTLFHKAHAAEIDLKKKAAAAKAAKGNHAKAVAAKHAAGVEKTAAKNSLNAAKNELTAAQTEVGNAVSSEAEAKKVATTKNAAMDAALKRYQTAKAGHLAASAAYAGAASAAAKAAKAYNAAVKAHCDAEAKHAEAVKAIGHAHLAQNKCRGEEMLVEDDEDEDEDEAEAEADIEADAEATAEVEVPCTPKPCVPICVPQTKYMVYGAFKIPYQENVCEPDKKCLAANAACIAKITALMKEAARLEADLKNKAAASNRAKHNHHLKVAAQKAAAAEKAKAKSAMDSAKAAFVVAEKEAANADSNYAAATKTTKDKKAVAAKKLAQYQQKEKAHLAAVAAYEGASSAAAKALKTYEAAVKAHCDAEAVHAQLVKTINHPHLAQKNCPRTAPPTASPTAPLPRTMSCWSGGDPHSNDFFGKRWDQHWEGTYYAFKYGDFEMQTTVKYCRNPVSWSKGRRIGCNYELGIQLKKGQVLNVAGKGKHKTCITLNGHCNSGKRQNFGGGLTLHCPNAHQCQIEHPDFSVKVRDMPPYNEFTITLKKRHGKFIAPGRATGYCGVSPNDYKWQNGIAGSYPCQNCIPGGAYKTAMCKCEEYQVIRSKAVVKNWLPISKSEMVDLNLAAHSQAHLIKLRKDYKRCKKVLKKVPVKGGAGKKFEKHMVKDCALDVDAGAKLKKMRTRFVRTLCAKILQSARDSKKYRAKAMKGLKWCRAHGFAKHGFKKMKGEEAEEDVEEDEDEEDEAQNLSEMLADDENEEDAEDLDVQGGQFLRKGRSSYGRSSRYSRSSRRRRSWGERRR